MSAISTTPGGRWFGFLDSFGVVGIASAEGVTTPTFPEQRALREILIGADDAEG